MEKQTGSNSSSQGTSESRDISLGCGPSPASSSAVTSSSQAAAAGSSVSGSGGDGGGGGGGDGGGGVVAGTSKFTSIAAQQQQQYQPSGASISGSLAGAASLLQQSPPPLTLNINTTTGGNFTVIVEASNTVENLRKVIAKKLKVAKDRICLLHREKELQDGTLRDNGLMDGSKIILIPNVETGLLAQRPENTVMQALESLNDSQVNDFLSGKTPLNLSMRLGDHMMLIQLQLSTVNPVNNTGHSGSSSSRTRSSTRSSRSSLSSAAGSSTQSGHNHHSHHHHHHHHHTNAQSATSVGSTSVLTPRNSDNDAANAHTSHRQRISSVSSIPSLRLPSSSGNSIRSSDLSSFLSKRDYESLQNIVRSIALAKPNKMPPPATTTTVGAQTEPLTAIASTSTSTTSCIKTIGCASPSTVTPTAGFHAPEEPTLLEQSPIKSLSNLVSSPIKTTAIKNIPIGSSGGISTATSSAVVTSVTGDAAAVTTCQDAISAKLTSCLCTRLNNSSSTSAPNGSAKSCIESTCQSRQEGIETSRAESRSAMLTSTPSKSSSSTMMTAAPSSSSLLHKTANNPIGRSKHRHHHHHHHHHHHYHHGSSNGSSNVVGGASNLRKMCVSPRSSSVLSTSTNDSGFASESDTATAIAATQQQSSSSTATPTSVDLDDSGVTLTDTRTLAEASRNLTQTLRKLSKEVFTNKIDLSSEETPRKSSSGAVIESMKNHGKGIYSGTFSGTLNPALQDRYGRPKRDISTVIHILNDLLSATPQYSRGARISFEAPSTSTAAGSSSSSGHASRSNKHPSKHHHHSYAHSLDSCVKCNKSQQHSSTTSSSSTNACAYGECNGHYTNASSKQAKHASYACCKNLSASSQHYQSTDGNNANDRNTCSCRYRIHSETGEREREHMCQKCLVEMENNKTKSKLDQLRLVMQQRKQKREARKLKGAPYGARVVGATTGVTSADASATTVTTASTGSVGSAASSSTTNPLTTQLTTASSSEVSPNHIVEEVDTAA